MDNIIIEDIVLSRCIYYNFMLCIYENYLKVIYSTLGKRAISIVIIIIILQNPHDYCCMSSSSAVIIAVAAGKGLARGRDVCALHGQSPTQHYV